MMSFDAHRHAAQHAAPGRVGGLRLGKRKLGIEEGPGLHHRLALGDAVEAVAHQLLRGERARLDPGRGFGGAERLHESALRTQAAMSSRALSSWQAADELDADRQSGRALGERQGDARHPEIGPQEIEGGLARGLQAERRLARRRRGQDGVEIGEQRIDARAARLAQLAGGDPGRVVDPRRRPRACPSSGSRSADAGSGAPRRHGRADRRRPTGCAGPRSCPTPAPAIPARRSPRPPCRARWRRPARRPSLPATARPCDG